MSHTTKKGLNHEHVVDVDSRRTLRVGPPRHSRPGRGRSDERCAVRAHGEQPGPATADVLFAPSPFSATDKRQHLVYEIAVQNVTSLELRLERLKVLDARRGKIVASYGGAEITEIMMGPTGEPRTRSSREGSASFSST